jgi:hypothetical protein
MILCACCRKEIAPLVIRTRFGRFESPLGLCRADWRRVGPALRALLIGSVREYQADPTTDQAVTLGKAWLLVAGEQAIADAERLVA